MVCDERISRGIEFQMTGAEQRNERKPKLVAMESGGDSAGQRNKENGQVGDSG